eukprot:m.72153 g.72153  ORF g.72153 m.72153 type:complete len:540 (-) comp8764_c0_seq2:346-1965(-)
MSGWDSWGLDSIASTFESAVAYVQDDLQEFVGTVTGDANAVAVDTVDKLSHAAHEGGAANLLSEVTSVAKGIASTLKDDVAAGANKKGSAGRARKKGGVMLGETREEAKVRELRHDPATYLTKPKDELHFAAWSDTFDLNSQVTEVSSLLSTDSSLRKLHAKLVPRKISYNQFWIRYFYALHVIKEKEQKRKALLDRFLPQKDDEGDGADDAWGDAWGDDEGGDNAAPRSRSADKARTPPTAAPEPEPTPPPKPPLERDLKKLRAQIKAFDTDFAAKHGRRASAADRRPIQDVVLLYKEVKAEAAAELAARQSSSAAAQPTQDNDDDGDDAGAVATAVESVAVAETDMFGEDHEHDGSAAVSSNNNDLDGVGTTTDTTMDDETSGVPTPLAPPDDHADTSPHGSDDDEDEVTFRGTTHDGSGDNHDADGIDAAATPVAAAATPAAADEDDANEERGGVNTAECPDDDAPGDSPTGSSDSSNMGVHSVPSSENGGGTGPGDSSSSFEVLESPTEAEMTAAEGAAAAPAANGSEDDEWGDW